MLLFKHVFGMDRRFFYCVTDRLQSFIPRQEALPIGQKPVWEHQRAGDIVNDDLDSLNVGHLKPRFRLIRCLLIPGQACAHPCAAEDVNGYLLDHVEHLVRLRHIRAMRSRLIEHEA